MHLRLQGIGSEPYFLNSDFRKLEKRKHFENATTYAWVD